MVKRKVNKLEEDSDIPNLRRSARRKQPVLTPQAAEADQAKSAESDAPQTSKSRKQRPQKQDVKASLELPKPKQETKETPQPISEEDEGSVSSNNSYWLMKAEPESRFERGVDVKFSIDDLASRTEPEPWDGKVPYG
ncbi:hypothetical protein Hte_008472 [Hypoxylon texense]